MMQRRSRPNLTTGQVAILIFTATLFAASLIGPGGFLLYQRQTGARAQATVDDCVASGNVQWRRVDCSGSWIVGGSLLEGGHVIVGTIQGVDESSVGKTIEVTLRGDEAYSRGLTLPLLLIGLGLVPAAAVPFILVASRRHRQANGPALPG